MSQMLAEISRIVNEDVSNRISQYDVLYEAITNSIHANATKIACKLKSFDNPQKIEGQEVIKRKLDVISIIDNGDGFNDNNYLSFCKYRSQYKKNLGCKGVGRFIYIKVYKIAKFKSRLVKEQEERSFKFILEFDTENLQKISTKVIENETELELRSLTNQYLDLKKGLDRRIYLDLESIKNKVLINLIPTLFFYKKKGVNINIEFVDENDGSKVEITEADIPNFLQVPFSIKDKNLQLFNFNLFYSLNKSYGNLHAYYCANNRTVCEFSDKDFKLALPYGYSGFLLLESKYFDKHVNNDRNDYDIYPFKTDVYSSLSWEIINNHLKMVISELVKESIPETSEINKEKLTKIQEERPYLINYIEEQDIEIAGFLDKNHIIEKAKKRFDHAKEKFLANSGKTDYSEFDLNEAIQITQNELVSYVFDRAQVIERLKSLINKKEKVESVIHNLFMEKYTQDSYFSIGKNNLWLLDDRFTNYTYAASDKRIQEILEEIGENSDEIENKDDKPDLSIFFSHNPEETQRLKSVLIEIKPFDFKNKPDRKKFQGIQQLVDYVKAFKKKEKIEEIWAFLITDIDIKLEDRLRSDDYIPLYSSEKPIFHRFYKDLGISIYVISAKTLISDAEARNKVFLNIIKKQSRLNEIIKKKENELSKDLKLQS